MRSFNIIGDIKPPLTTLTNANAVVINATVKAITPICKLQTPFDIVLYIKDHEKAEKFADEFNEQNKNDLSFSSYGEIFFRDFPLDYPMLNGKNVLYVDEIHKRVV